MNLKSRLAILEEKVFSENKSTLPVGLGKCNDPPSGNTSEMNARDNPLNYNNGYCIKNFNTQNKAELITAENIVKQGKLKEPENHHVNIARNRQSRTQSHR